MWVSKEVCQIGEPWECKMYYGAEPTEQKEAVVSNNTLTRFSLDECDLGGTIGKETGANLGSLGVEHDGCST